MSTEIFLVARTPKLLRREWSLTEGEQIIGRSRGCDIVIPDETVSREHARVCVDNGIVSIVDLGSRNGTIVGNDRVATEVVSIGSLVQFGRIECLVADVTMLEGAEACEYSTIDHSLEGRDKLIECLSDAERRVLHPLLDGLSEKEVAFRLELSPNTVHHHVQAIYRAFKVSSRAELLAFFLRAAK